MENVVFTLNEVGLMLTVIADLIESGDLTAENMLNPKAKSLYYKIKAVPREMISISVVG